MKQIFLKRITSLCLVVGLLLGICPEVAFTANAGDDFTVTISMEGLTLGQGMYVAPVTYTLSEINALLDELGYAARTEDDLTAAMVTVAMMKDKGIEYKNTGDPESSFYLSGVKGIDKGTVDIPAVITENGGPDNDSHDGNDDEYLGEFDYGSMSGWMITVNHLMIPVGAGQYTVEDDAVIRWQFTLWGYGSDLGIDNGWGMGGPYFDAANKDALYRAYAASTDAAKKAAALPVMEALTATQAEVDAATAALTYVAPPAPRTPQDVSSTLNPALAKLAATVTEPVFDTFGGEWSVLCLARGGYYKADSAYFSDYYNRIVETVNTTAASVNQDGALNKTKSTENSRLILALSAIGKPATQVGDWNLITPFDNFTWIKKQGINGPIFALIALDTRNYQTTDTTIRQQCIDFILGKQLADGGWAYSGTSVDPDITAMAIQALENYQEQPAVATAILSAITALSAIQQETGGYASWGSVNSESIAQVIVACATLGINPDTDSRFIKNGHSVVDALLAFYNADSANFSHKIGDGGDAMATDQCIYALVAYQRLLAGKNPLYNMTDVTLSDPTQGDTPQNKALSATLGLPAEISGNAGTTFYATVKLTGWDNAAGYKLMDSVLTVPSALDVTSVTVGSRFSGGQVEYHLEAETGKLRVVYLDAQNYADLKCSETGASVELLRIGFTLKEALDPQKIAALQLSVGGMSFKRSSDPNDKNAMTVVDTQKASGSVTVVKGISFRAVCLYQGDGVDLIPADRKAVAVAVTELSKPAAITCTDGKAAVTLYYNAAISEKTGVSSYVALVDAEMEMTWFTDPAHYTVDDTHSAETLTFGDANSDGVINAQDALGAVDAWLRKGDAPDSTGILRLNVNADSRINTYDALGIVEAFVNATEYGVVSKATVVTAD